VFDLEAWITTHVSSAYIPVQRLW